MPAWLTTIDASGSTFAVRWLVAIGMTTLGYQVIWHALRFCIRRLEGLGRGSGTFADLASRVLARTHRLVVFLVALVLAVQLTGVGDSVADRLQAVWFPLLGLQLAMWLNCAVSLWHDARLGRHTPGTYNPVIATMMTWCLRAVVWTTLLLAALANVGVDITAFVASLGVGGVAVALAVQNILSDLFASLAIGLDKPFEIDDFIVFGNVSGTIEHVGLKTTRIRSLSGEQVICSNTTLLKQEIRNFKRMQERRIRFGFSVPYGTASAQLRDIPGLVRHAIDATANSRFDRAHLLGVGTGAFDFEVVYYVIGPSYDVYMDVQQQINFTIIDAFAERGIAFALPAHAIHIAGDTVRSRGIELAGQAS